MSIRLLGWTLGLTVTGIYCHRGVYNAASNYPQHTLASLDLQDHMRLPRRHSYRAIYNWQPLARTFAAAAVQSSLSTSSDCTHVPQNPVFNSDNKALDRHLERLVSVDQPIARLQYVPTAQAVDSAHLTAIFPMAHLDSVISVVQ